MAGDIYGAKGSIGGVFKGTKVKLIVGSSGAGSGGDGGSNAAMVQNIAITYTRNVTRIWELGSDDTYYVIGHTEGTAQLNRIVAKATSDILDQFADACTAKDKTLKIEGTTTACDGTPKLNLTLTGPVMTQTGFSIDVGQFLIANSIAMMFSSLSMNITN